MTRAFLSDPVSEALRTRLVDSLHTGPSAGNTSAVETLELCSSVSVQAYWEVTLPEERRMGFPWPGLLHAPLLLLIYVEPQRYLDRYSEPDKARSGLGEGLDRWKVPYWWVDAGAAVQTLLLAATAAGLGACLFGQFDNEDALKSRFAVPAGFRSVGTVAIGHPDHEAQRLSKSVSDRVTPRKDVHEDRW